MVGGYIIEVTLLNDGSFRLWVVDGMDELFVRVKDTGDGLPDLGGNMWWQGGKVYFDNDRRSCAKVAYSYRPSRRAPEDKEQ